MCPVAERRADRYFGLLLFTCGQPLDGDGWQARLDQATCSKRDIARSQVYILQVAKKASRVFALILQKTGQGQPSGRGSTLGRESYTPGMTMSSLSTLRLL